jgi:hypothetical protein
LIVAAVLEQIAGDLLRQAARRASADVAGVEVIEAVVQDSVGQRRAEM